MSTGPVTGAPVLVTGASGFIGSQTVRLLLEAAYRVRGTVRDPRRAQAEGHLLTLPGAGSNLELIAADLRDPASFVSAVRGCEYVIHTASPYAVDVEDPLRDLVEPAVGGTVAVLEACLGEPTVKRVVITSSAAAITDRADGHVYTEDDWNTTSTLVDNPYYFSKTLAERAAWDFVETRGPRFDLVVINPFLVIGPSLVPGVNTSHGSLLALTNGSMPGIIPLEWPLVDVRDVALAHLLAMERPSASGRYLLGAESRSVRQVVELLRSEGWADRHRLPTIALDGRLGLVVTRLGARFQPAGTRAYLDNHLGGRMRFDNSKARRDLGLDFRDVDQTIIDTMEDMERWGHLGRRR